MCIYLITKHTKTPTDGHWWPGTPLKITLALQCPIVEGWGVCVQTDILKIMKSFGDLLPMYHVYHISDLVW